jgi:hypothetical protein
LWGCRWPLVPPRPHRDGPITVARGSSLTLRVSIPFRGLTAAIPLKPDHLIPHPSSVIPAFGVLTAAAPLKREVDQIRMGSSGRTFRGPIEVYRIDQPDGA